MTLFIGLFGLLAKEIVRRVARRELERAGHRQSPMVTAIGLLALELL